MTTFMTDDTSAGSLPLWLCGSSHLLAFTLHSIQRRTTSLASHAVNASAVHLARASKVRLLPGGAASQWCCLRWRLQIRSKVLQQYHKDIYTYLDTMMQELNKRVFEVPQRLIRRIIFCS